MWKRPSEARQIRAEARGSMKYVLEATGDPNGIGAINASASILAHLFVAHILGPATSVENGTTLCVKTHAVHELGKCIDLIALGGRPVVEDLLEKYRGDEA